MLVWTRYILAFRENDSSNHITTLTNGSKEKELSQPKSILCTLHRLLLLIVFQYRVFWESLSLIFYQYRYRKWKKRSGRESFLQLAFFWMDQEWIYQPHNLVFRLKTSMKKRRNYCTLMHVWIWELCQLRHYLLLNFWQSPYNHRPTCEHHFYHHIRYKNINWVLKPAL